MSANQGSPPPVDEVDVDTHRILVVNCNVTQKMSDVIDRSAKSAVSRDTQVATITPTFGVDSAEGYFDSQLAAVGMLHAIRSHGLPFDAVVLAGFGECGREAAREMLTVPVVDITDAAAHVALQVAPRYGVVTTLVRAKVQIADSLHAAGVAENCIGIRASDLPVLKTQVVDLGPDSLIVEAGRRLVDDGAEAIVLGCAGFAGLDRALEDELGVPVIDPVAAGTALAEALVRMKLRTSKLCSFSAPRDKVRPGWDRYSGSSGTSGMLSVIPSRA